MQLHEQTQRLILLLIFYLFGPIVTLGIIGGIVVRKLPANARSLERSLTQQTGLHWTIQSVEYRSLGVIRLHSVKMLDDTAQQTVFYAKQIDVRRAAETSRKKIFPGISATSDTDQSSHWTGLTGFFVNLFPSARSADQFWHITVSASFLDFRKYPGEHSALLIQNMLQKVFARFDALADVPVQFVLEEIIVVSEQSLKKEGDKAEDKVDMFRFVQGNIYRTSTEIRSDWSFQIKDISDLDPVHLSFALALTGTLDITFRTGRLPIPCDLAAVFCVPFNRFSGGTFQGEFALSTRSVNNARTIRLNNVVFHNVPLAPLVGPYTDFAVAGTVANLQFRQAVFGTEGIDVLGSLHVLNGTIATALFHRCVDRFDLTVRDPTGKPHDSILDSPERTIPFTESAILFRLQPDGINFGADQLWQNALMYYQKDAFSPAEWIVSLPPHRQIVTYHELMSIFAADSAPVVPLTPGLRDVVPYIPVR